MAGRTQRRASRGAAAPFACHLVIMVKAATAGRVKSRLAAEIGVARATAFYRHASGAVIARLAGSPRWRTWLAITPDTAAASRCWPAQVRRIPQGSGDLGRRMQRVFDRMPPGPVVLIGSDIPAVTPGHVARAFRRLAGADVVLGPAEDGGYWLVGLSRLRRRPRLFDDVRWSGPAALADTLRNAGAARVALADRLADADRRADYDAVAAWAGRRVLPVPASA